MFSNKQFHIIASLFYGFCLLVGIKSYFDQVLIHQLASPVIFDGAVDLLTYLGIGTNLFSTIVNTPILSYIFDGILLLVPCILLFKPQLIGLAILNFLTWLIYICIYNLYGTHQTHSLLGILILQIPFLFYGKNLFSWWWNAARYYIIWIFFSAGMWKIIRGSFLYPPQTKNIYLQNHVGKMLETKANSLDKFVLSNPTILEWIFPIGVLLEILFVLGFFTKKFDQYLVLLMLILILGFKFLADATFYEWIILTLPFLFKISLNQSTGLHVPKQNG